MCAVSHLGKNSAVLLGQATPLTPDERSRWVRRARLLAGLGVGWHVAEAAIAILAGALAGSVAMMGFGADSVVEALAGCVVLWRFASTRSSSIQAERRAQQLIALSFLLVAAYVGVEAVRHLLAGETARASGLGIALAVVTTVTMPLLAGAKARLAVR